MTYYGLDLYKERKLADLLRALVKVDGIEWIRFITCSIRFLKTFWTSFVRSKVCNYIDIPLQHIADPVLKAGRGTTKAKTDALLDKMREKVPGITIRTTPSQGILARRRKITKSFLIG